MAGVNMSRDESLAGQSVKQGSYTVTYDQNGYAKKAVKDGGSSATSTKKTTNATNSAAHQAMYEAAKSGDWDTVGTLSNGLVTEDGDFSEGNAYLKELADEFKYNVDDYYGTGTGSGSSGGSTGRASGGSTSASSTQYGGSSDLTEYLKEAYAQNMAAELAGLKSAYEQNTASLQANESTINDTYEAARNQAAAQAELEKLYMNEYGLARGLNTGTSGQMALAQSAVAQGNLADIGAQEANALADNALQLKNLETAYNNAVAQAEASGNAELATALYNEYIRQEEAAYQQYLNEQTQANYLAEWEYQKEQDALAQENYLAELAYQKQQDELAYQLSLYNAGLNSSLGTKAVSSGSSGSGGSGGTSDPVLTYAQTMQAIENGYLTPNVLSAYKFYMGEDYNIEDYNSTDISKLDTSDFRNVSGGNVVKITHSNGASAWVNWSVAASKVASGEYKLERYSDGTYEIKFANE